MGLFVLPGSLYRRVVSPVTESIGFTKPMPETFQRYSENNRSEFAEETSEDIDLIKSETDPLKREEKIERLLGNLTPAQIPAVLDLLAEQPTDAMNRHLQILIIRKWAAAYPEQASLWAESIDPAGRQAALQAVAVVWCENDPSAAASWVTNLPPGDTRVSMTESLCFELARTNPLWAMHLAVELPEGSRQDDLIAGIAAEWAVKDHNAALTWVNEVSGEALKEKLFSSLAKVVVDADPAQAVELALYLSPETRRNDALLGIVQRWAQNEPATAAAWVQQSEDFSFRTQAMKELVSLWSHRDPHDMALWLNQIETGPLRDEWLVQFVESITGRDPKAAVLWSETITDPGERDRHLHDNLGSWLQVDTPAAAAYLAESSIEEEVKLRLLARCLKQEQ